MSEAFGPSSCPSGFVLKSTLLHKPQAQYGLVPKLRHHGGKNNDSVEPEKPEMFKPHGNSILWFFVFFFGGADFFLYFCSLKS